MRRPSIHPLAACAALLLAACSSVDAPTDASPLDAPAVDACVAIPTDAVDAPDVTAAPDAVLDAAASDACSVSGAPGECISLTACVALGDHTSFAGHCPGPADIECCITTPNVADNPPTPAGYMLMAQADVTPAMTAWAVEILNDPTTYPMFDSVTMTFGALPVLARVEWHPPDFQNSVVHRGVTLYQPI